MSETVLEGKENMLIISVATLHNLAGVYLSDSELEQDLKISAWLGRQKYRIIDHDPVNYTQQVDDAARDGMQVLIIKESTNVNKPRHNQICV